MGLRAGGALRRVGTVPGAPEGQEPGGAQGGSIHSGCITTVHNVPISVLIRPLPSVLDPAKVQSLVDTILVSPRSLPARARKRGREGRGPGSAGAQLRLCDLDGLGWRSLPGPQVPHLDLTMKVMICDAHTQKCCGCSQLISASLISSVK